jgi:hypothetical protein
VSAAAARRQSIPSRTQQREIIVIKRALTTLALGAVIAGGGVTVAETAQARPVPDPPATYCGPGYYPSVQYGGRCVAKKRLIIGKPSVFQPWKWSF